MRNDVSNHGQLITQNGAAIDQTNLVVTNLASATANGSIGPVRYSSVLSPNLPNGGVVSQDLTLVGLSTGPVRLHNVADGIVAAGSTDAVNGSQLAATNADILSINGTLSQYDSRIIANSNAIIAGSIALTNLHDDVANGALGPVRYSSSATQLVPSGQPTQHLFLTGASSAPASIHNLADGVVSAGSLDAVNGGQLYNVVSNVDNLANLAALYDDSSRSSLTLGGAGHASVTIRNVADGQIDSTSLDAVNGRQLAATNMQIANNITALSTLTDAVAQGRIGLLQYSSANAPLAPGSGVPGQDMMLIGGAQGAVRLHNIADGIVAAGSTDAVNGGQIFNLTGSVDSLSLLALQYDDASRSVVSLGGTGRHDVRIRNLANGTIAAQSNDAVNGGQLFAVVQQVDANTQSIADVNADMAATRQAVGTLRTDAENGIIGLVRFSDPLSPLTPNSGTPTNDMILVGGQAGSVRLHNVAQGTVAAGSTDAINGGQFYDAMARLDGVTSLALNYDDANRTSVTLGGVGALPVSIANVADGDISATSFAAVNGRQLNATNASIATLRDDYVAQNTLLQNTSYQLSQFTVDFGNGAIGPLRYSSAASPTTPLGQPSQHLMLMGAQAGTVALHNISDGAISSSSTDAVTGRQLNGIATNFADVLGYQYNPTTNSVTGAFRYAGKTTIIFRPSLPESMTI